MSSHLKTTNDTSFDTDVLGAKQPVLVDFWAEWCGPCKALTPTLEETAATYQDRVAIVKLNIDESPNTPTRFGIRAIPTLILFKDGQAIASKTGALSKSQLAAFLDEHI